MSKHVLKMKIVVSFLKIIPLKCFCYFLFALVEVSLNLEVNTKQMPEKKIDPLFFQIAHHDKLENLFAHFCLMRNLCHRSICLIQVFIFAFIQPNLLVMIYHNKINRSCHLLPIVYIS